MVSNPLSQIGFGEVNGFASGALSGISMLFLSASCISKVLWIKFF